MKTSGVGLGQLLLALDATMVTLGRGPARAGPAGGLGGADRRRRRAAGPGRRRRLRRRVLPARRRRRRRAGVAGSADRRRRAPAAIFVKEPSDAVVARAVAAGTAVVAVEPRARWERLYRLVDHVFEHHGDRADPLYDSGTDLFGLAQSIADRTPRHGQHRGRAVARAGVLGVQRRGRRAAAAVDPRARGPAGAPGLDRPVGHLRRAARDAATWSASTNGPSWGCARAARSASISRPPTGAGPRVRGHHLGAAGFAAAGRRRRRRAARRGGAGGADHVAAGGDAVDARGAGCRNCSACATVRRDDAQVADLARELGIVADGRAAVIGFDGAARRPSRLADVLALSASAFRPDAQVAARGSRVYVLFPHTGKAAVGDVVDPRHDRRPAHRARARAAGRDRHSRNGSGAASPPPAPRWTACSTAPSVTPAPSAR